MHMHDVWGGQTKCGFVCVCVYDARTLYTKSLDTYHTHFLERYFREGIHTEPNGHVIIVIKHLCTD